MATEKDKTEKIDRSLKSVTVGQAKEIIKKQMSDPEACAMPILLVAEMGVGKSEIVQQVCAEGVDPDTKKPWGYVERRCAQCDPGDFTGIPRPSKDESKTIWLAPSDWPQDKDSKGIFFLDEINRGKQSTRDAIMQIFTERKIFTHSLPKKWGIVAAINPDDGSYQVDPLDPALNNRCEVLILDVDVREWVKWAYDAGVHENVCHFISAHSELLMFKNKQVNQNVTAFPTPRSWYKVSVLEKAGVLLKDISFQQIQGLVGMEAATSYQTFNQKNYERPVMGNEILNDWAKVKDKYKAQQRHQTYATVTDLIGYVGTIKKTTDKIADNFKDFMKASDKEDQMSIIYKAQTSWVIELILSTKDIVSNLIGQKTKIEDILKDVLKANEKK